MADDGAVKRGSGETTMSRLELVTLRALVAHAVANAREGWDGKGLEQHGHMRARSAAVMATRWSRAHGESYLRRKWSGGGVTDVEELTVVLRQG